MQDLCPEPGCVSDLSHGTSDWAQIGDLWWCPLHWFGEHSRLKEQRKEIVFWEGALLNAKAKLLRCDGDRDAIRSRARREKVYYKDPVVQRQLAEVDDFERRVRAQIEERTQKRDAALARHDADNEQRRKSLQLPDENSA